MNDADHQHSLAVADHFKRQIKRYEWARSECAKDLVRTRDDQVAMNRAMKIQAEQILLIRAHKAHDTNYFFPDI